MMENYLYHSPLRADESQVGCHSCSGVGIGGGDGIDGIQDDGAAAQGHLACAENEVHVVYQLLRCAGQRHLP